VPFVSSFDYFVASIEASLRQKTGVVTKLDQLALVRMSMDGGANPELTVLVMRQDAARLIPPTGM
jgi:hypothetical protein